jgi:hypothetical protein
MREGPNSRDIVKKKLDEARMKVEKIRLPDNGDKPEVSDFE